MIKLNRPYKPNILAQHEETWTNSLLEYVRANQPVPETLLRNYRHDEIKEALEHCTSKKCIYCESKPLAVTYGEVEHIRPKKTYPQLTFNWENLGLVCRKCNNKKSDNYDETCPPVNPFSEEPSEFFGVKGSIVHAKFGNDRGRLTEKLIGLNRADLIERRAEKIMELISLIESAAGTPLALRKEIFKQAKQMCSAEKEFSFVLKKAYQDYLTENNLAEPNQEQE